MIVYLIKEGVSQCFVPPFTSTFTALGKLAFGCLITSVLHG